MKTLIVDCDRCSARPRACADCAISALLGVPDSDSPPALSGEEQRVLGLFADSGLIPPLRLVPRDVPEPGEPGDGRRGRPVVPVRAAWFEGVREA